MKKIICIVLLVLVTFSTVASAVPSTIDLSPSEKTADVGDVFTVTLNVIVVGEADTVAIDLITWNANVLNCTGIAIGDLFQDVLIWLPGTIKAGSIKGSVMASNIPISNKSGTYSTLSFKVKGSGDTTITVHGFGVARAGEPLDTSILGDCRITVLGVPSPNPPSNPADTTNDSFAIPPIHPPIDDNDTVIPPVIPHKPVIPPIQNNSQNDTNNSKYQPISNESNANKSNGEPPLSLYFALIATVIVLLTVSIFVRKRQKRKEKKEKDEEVSDEDIFN